MTERGVTAVFVANDQMALGMLRAFAEAGVSVPRDVQRGRLRRCPRVRLLQPALTTVRQDFIEVGRQAFELLLARLRDEDRGARHLITPELIVRESTGPR
ncbi:hypothetical protein GCM10018954_029410 [Kutzneria kofuensis]